jgi:hypothetical protein
LLRGTWIRDDLDPGARHGRFGTRFDLIESFHHGLAVAKASCLRGQRASSRLKKID